MFHTKQHFLSTLASLESFLEDIAHEKIDHLFSLIAAGEGKAFEHEIHHLITYLQKSYYKVTKAGKYYRKYLGEEGHFFSLWSDLSVYVLEGHHTFLGILGHLLHIKDKLDEDPFYYGKEDCRLQLQEIQALAVQLVEGIGLHEQQQHITLPHLIHKISQDMYHNQELSLVH